jgi:N-methylhydantoinase A
MRGYIIPASAGVTSALGFLTAPVSFELARSVLGPVTPGRLAELDGVYEALEEEGRGLLHDAGIGTDEMTFVRQADLRHSGQGHELVLELPYRRLADVDLERDVAPLFYNAYEAVYGHAHRHLPLEIVTCRVTAAGPLPTVTVRQEEAGSATPEPALTGSRRAFFLELGGFVDTPTYDRAWLRPGASFDGPAIVEEQDSTAVIGPGGRVSVDRFLNLIVSFE